MKTEDDTFRILKRVPAEQALAEFTSWWLKTPGSVSTKQADEFLRPLGWTFEELWIAPR